MKPILTLATLTTLSLASGLRAVPRPPCSVYGVIDAYVAGRFKGAATGVKSPAPGRATKSKAAACPPAHIGLSRPARIWVAAWRPSFEHFASFMRNDAGASGRGDAIGAPVNVAGDHVHGRALRGSGCRARSGAGCRLTTPNIISTIRLFLSGDHEQCLQPDHAAHRTSAASSTWKRPLHLVGPQVRRYSAGPTASWPTTARLRCSGGFTVSGDAHSLAEGPSVATTPACVWVTA